MTNPIQTSRIPKSQIIIPLNRRPTSPVSRVCPDRLTKPGVSRDDRWQLCVCHPFGFDRVAASNIGEMRRNFGSRMHDSKRWKEIEQCLKSHQTHENKFKKELELRFRAYVLIFWVQALLSSWTNFVFVPLELNWKIWKTCPYQKSHTRSAAKCPRNATRYLLQFQKLHFSCNINTEC